MSEILPKLPKNGTPRQITVNDDTTPSDREVLARVSRKISLHQELTQDEERVVRRYEKKKEERLRWEYYSSIPKKHWRQMSGRSDKVIIEHADKYGLPLLGATISLPKLARALHDFISENVKKLNREDDAMLEGNASPALERYREEKAEMARLDRLERQGKLIPRDRMRRMLGRVAAIIRSGGEKLQLEFGAKAAEILYEVMDDASRQIEAGFAEGMDNELTESPQSVDDSESPHDVTKAE